LTFVQVKRLMPKGKRKRQAMSAWLGLAQFDVQRLEVVGCVAAHQQAEPALLEVPAAVVMGESLGRNSDLN
jgi:hypothetical protein